MEALMNQIKSSFADADELGRKKVLDDLRALSYSLETKQDAIQRIMYSEFELPVVRIGCDIDLFEALLESKESKGSLTLTELAKKTSVEDVLLARILRFLASHGYIQETSKDTFAANKHTEFLTDPRVKSGVYHYADTVGPAVHHLPEWLKGHKYKNITKNNETPLQEAQKTDLPGFMWLPSQPEKMQNFQKWMAVAHEGLRVWQDVYPIGEKIRVFNESERKGVFFVDVGGGLGQQSGALMEKAKKDFDTDLSGKVVVQDLGMVLEFAKMKPYPGVEYREHNFFTEQTPETKGAAIFYLRNILHDYPDEEAVKILKTIKGALEDKSVILIDDMIIPETGAHWHATQLDITMMSSLGSMERTLVQWDDLLKNAGLKRKGQPVSYTATLQDSIIECVSL